MNLRCVPVALVLCFILSCSMFETRKLQLTNALPRETDVPGWILKQKKVTKDRGKIETINRVYYLFGAQEYARAVFYSLSDENIEMTVELMRFPSPFHCFGLFSFERGFNPDLIESQTDGFISKNGAYGWRGEYYIKATSNKESVSLVNDYKLFNSVMAANVESHASEAQLPPYVYTFSENYSTLDVVYYVMGHRLLPGSKNVFVRKKLIQQKERYVFFIREPSPVNASEIYNNILKNTKPPFVITKTADIQMGYGPGDGKRFVFLGLYRDYVYGVLNAEDVNDGFAIMKRLHRDLSGYYESSRRD